MKLGLQFAGGLLVLGTWAALPAPSLAQRHAPPPAHFAQSNPSKPPKPSNPPRQDRRPPQNAPRNQPQQRPQNQNPNRPPQFNPNSANGNARPNNNPNRPPSAYTPPPARKFNQLSPQEKQRVIENYKKYQKLPPDQRQRFDDGKGVWGRLTPQQQNHLRSDVLPKWKQLPQNRQRAISQRLGVLQNMPESARNQHLDDPNFTRGMNEEDKSMLRDLSHMHVGAPPEPPSE